MPHVDQIAGERERNGNRQSERRRQQGMPNVAGQRAGISPGLLHVGDLGEGGNQCQHRSQQAQHGSGPDDGRDPRLAEIELGQHLGSKVSPR